MMRLDKMLAHIGIGSRKQVKQLIRSKNVLVNGVIITDDDYKVDEVNDEVEVFDQKVDYLSEVYILLNKPKGVVSATYDPNKETVIDLVSEYANYKIFPVGRLDIDTTGLLLITNDGELCHNLLSPSKHVDKTYLVTFEGEFKDCYVEKFNKGIRLDDGYLTMPSDIKLISENQAELTIHEGKFHQVKRMFKALNMEVVELERVSFGSLKLDNTLKYGEYRLLTSKEIEDLKESR